MILKKSDLKNGMVVEFNNGERRLLWEGKLIDKRGYIPMQYINEELYNMDSISREHITEVYLSHDVGYFDDFFNNESLTCIWKR